MTSISLDVFESVVRHVYDQKLESGGCCNFEVRSLLVGSGGLFLYSPFKQGRRRAITRKYGRFKCQMISEAPACSCINLPDLVLAGRHYGTYMCMHVCSTSASCCKLRNASLGLDLRLVASFRMHEKKGI